MSTHFVRYIEIFFVYPFVEIFGKLSFFCSKWGTVSTAMAAFTLFVRATITNYSFHFDQSRFASLSLSFSNRFGNSRKIISVFNAKYLPTISIKTLSHVLGEGKVQFTIKGNII
ncbi:hypothetical protein D3C71_1397590 [compost metagenome]